MRVESEDVRVSMNRVRVSVWGRVEGQSVRMTPVFTVACTVVNSQHRMSAHQILGRETGGTVPRSHVFPQPNFPIGMDSLQSEEIRRGLL